MSQPGTYIAAASPLPVFLGVCDPCRRPNRVRDENARGDTLTATCPDCGNPTKLERLFGTLTRMNCHPLCEGATGPSCSCACAGTNHGGAWAKSGEMLASALKRYRDGLDKRAAAATARAEARAKAERTAFTDWYEAANTDGDLDWLTSTDWEDEFLASMAERVNDGKALSPRQLPWVPKIRARMAARAAERAARDANATEVPTGRHEVSGVVLARRTEPSPFGYDREVTKVLVDAGTYRVWGTLPAAIGYADKGDRVKFTATLEPKAGEVGFGFYSRPTKAEYIPPAEGSGPNTATCESCQRPIWQAACGRWFHNRNGSESCGSGSVSWARPPKAVPA